jgi:hypothetical protein
MKLFFAALFIAAIKAAFVLAQNNKPLIKAKEIIEKSKL